MQAQIQLTIEPSDLGLAHIIHIGVKTPKGLQYHVREFLNERLLTESMLDVVFDHLRHELKRVIKGGED